LTALEFEKTANFQNYLGAVDGKHIRVIKPEHSGSMFYNYKDPLPPRRGINQRSSSIGINGRGKHQLPSYVR